MCAYGQVEGDLPAVSVHVCLQESQFSTCCTYIHVYDQRDQGHFITFLMASNMCTVVECKCASLCPTPFKLIWPLLVSTNEKVKVLYYYR